MLNFCVAVDQCSKKENIFFRKHSTCITTRNNTPVVIYTTKLNPLSTGAPVYLHSVYRQQSKIEDQDRFTAKSI